MGDQAAEGLPNRWPGRRSPTRRRRPAPSWPTCLYEAVVGTSLKMRAPLGPGRLFGAAQLVLAVVAVLGFLWLAVLVVMGWLQLPDLDTPSLDRCPTRS